MRPSPAASHHHHDVAAAARVCAGQTGREAVACLWDAVVAACDGVVLPRAIARRQERACGLVDRSAGGRRERRLLQRAAGLFARAAQVSGKPRVEPTCGAAVGGLLRDAESATRLLLDAIPRAT